jgi:hypothetical protein
MIGHWDAGPWVDPKRRLSPGTGKRNNSGGFGAAEGAKKKTSDGELGEITPMRYLFTHQLILV